jgi:hypothetical protein
MGGLWLSPQALSNDLATNNRVAGDLYDPIRNAMNALEDFVYSSSGTGHAYSALKKRFKDYDIPLMKGYYELVRCLVGYYHIHKPKLAVFEKCSQGLSEQALDHTIRKFKKDSNAWIQNPDGSSKNVKLNAKANHVIKIATKKLQKLRDYNTQTANLYSDTEDLAALVKRGIEFLQVIKKDNSGNWTSPVLDNSWQEELNKAVSKAEEDLNNADVAASKDNHMVLSPDNQYIYYNGQAYKVYDPTYDYNPQTGPYTPGYDPEKDPSWQTTETKAYTANSYDPSAWLRVGNQPAEPPSMDGADPGDDYDNERAKDIEAKVGAAQAAADTVAAVYTSGGVVYVFQHKGNAKRVIIHKHSTDPSPDGPPDDRHYDTYTHYKTDGKDEERERKGTWSTFPLRAPDDVDKAEIKAGTANYNPEL